MLIAIAGKGKARAVGVIKHLASAFSIISSRVVQRVTEWWQGVLKWTGRVVDQDPAMRFEVLTHEDPLEACIEADELGPRRLLGNHQDTHEGIQPSVKALRRPRMRTGHPLYVIKSSNSHSARIDGRS